MFQIYTKAMVPKPHTPGAPRTAQPELVEAEVLLSELLVELPKVTLMSIFNSVNVTMLLKLLIYLKRQFLILLKLYCQYFKKVYMICNVRQVYSSEISDFI